MKRDCGKLKIYKRLSGGKGAAAGEAVFYTIAIAFIELLLGCFLLAMIYERRYGAAVGAGFLVALFACVAVYLMKKTVPMKKRAEQKRQKIVESLSDEDFFRLDSQINGAEYFFKTFYFLEDHLYVPRGRLLIGYLNITNVNTIVHSTNGITDAAYVEITDEEGIVTKFSVAKWRDFLDMKYMFDDMLSENIARCGEKNI